MPSLLEEKLELRPVNYPQFQEAYHKVLFSPWHPFELEIEPDILDWMDRLTMGEKRVVGNLFKAFTVQEEVVNCYWRWLADILGQPEAIHMAAAFSNQESNHAISYDLLEANLPMAEVVTVDFKEDLVAQKKLDTIIDFQDIDNLVTSLAAFSAFVEGVSLYSSFAVLMSFQKKGYLKTMFQILTWSVRDERLHSNMGIALAKQLIADGEGVMDEEAIYQAAEIVCGNEVEFLQQAFKDDKDLGFVDLEQAISFVYHRGNKKLMQLGLKPIFENNFKYKPLAEFFYTSLEGRGMNDFFALSRNGGGYSATLTQDFTKCNFE